jgi:outer membrane protein assembly factor BamB
VSSPALYKDLIYALERNDPPRHGVNLLAIDKNDGTVVLNKSINRYEDGDASSVFVYNETVVFALRPAHGHESDMIHNVYAANASDGSFLWEYEPDDSLWNFAPSTPGDGTLIMSGSCGGVYRITFEGKLVWKVAPTLSADFVGVQQKAEEKKKMCGTGGGAMGPNNIFYYEYNDHDGSFIAARRVEDGHLLWRTEVTGFIPPAIEGPLISTSGIANQYPAVGEVRYGPFKRLAVVAGLGNNLPIGGLVMPQQPPGDGWINVVIALDPETGDLLWRYDEPAWPHKFAEGDDKMAQRTNKSLEVGGKADVVCWPDPQGIPLISGDGTVYMSSSHHGALRSMADKDGSGTIDPSELSTFETHNCFLNSPSIADGMLVAAPCWGSMYVFKSEARAFIGTA